MQKISPSQLRAARALLNWSRADLAKRSGISEPTIHRFENSTNEPEARTAKKLLNVFDSHGVEFTEHQGVRFKPSNVDVYDGVERFDYFYEFFYDHVNRYGGNICLSIYEESLLPRLRKNPDLHRKRMKELFDRKAITFRILTAKSDFVSHGYAQFRWQPQLAMPTGFYAFGDCLALMSFVNPRSPHIVVLHSSPLADAYRQSFDIAWKQAESPPVITAKHQTIRKR